MSTSRDTSRKIRHFFLFSCFVRNQYIYVYVYMCIVICFVLMHSARFIIRTLQHTTPPVIHRARFVNDESLWQNIVSFLGLFCKRDLLSLIKSIINTSLAYSLWHVEWIFFFGKIIGHLPWYIPEDSSFFFVLMHSARFIIRTLQHTTVA